MQEPPALAVRQATSVLEGFLETAPLKDNLRPQPATAFDFGSRCPGRHDHANPQSKVLPSEGNPLGVIARRRGHYRTMIATLDLGGQRVQGTTDLERPRNL